MEGMFRGTGELRMSQTASWHLRWMMVAWSHGRNTESGMMAAHPHFPRSSPGPSGDSSFKQQSPEEK